MDRRNNKEKKKKKKKKKRRKSFNDKVDHEKLICTVIGLLGFIT